MTRPAKIGIFLAILILAPLALAAATSGRLQLALIVVSIPVIAAVGTPVVLVRHSGMRRRSGQQMRLPTSAANR